VLKEKGNSVRAEDLSGLFEDKRREIVLKRDKTCLALPENGEDINTREHYRTRNKELDEE
jgi:hypothetical protein